MVYFITGRKGSGKTTKARQLANSLKQKGHSPVILDGDEVRAVFLDIDFGDQGRLTHIMRMASFAKLLENQGFTPIIACVSPKAEWRRMARKLFQSSTLIYMPGGTLWEGTTYEEPQLDEL